LEKRTQISNDINAMLAKELLYGRVHIIKFIKKNTGSIFGLKKDTRFANYARSQVIAEQNLSELKTIGLANHPKNEQNLVSTNT
jgi:hypothetical protein